ncbi:helix-turn-helix domain-containing protein [Acetobacter orientalis]|uniref:MerR family transcriptional regulator n=1 Tax=Acetobacter orientalis TaxID=146474 RepID=UPI00209F8205|nr:helix-turn-helix domain-containing protein [Acetobacter orientalis]MCP1215332.1 helix-turn-helix domain-containing protein [Acetobacter orientalis]MCP1218915.1 helix-turn-helix domain-containing protein [Acetobacter orientalis]
MFSIGKLSGSTGVKVPTIRYYEQIGILEEPDRSEGGQRVYGEEAKERLSFIRHARELGFSLDEIRELLDLADDPNQNCTAAYEIAKRQLIEVRNRIARLTALQGELQRMLDQCSCNTIGTCRIIQVLSDHSLCTSEHLGTEAGCKAS